MKAYQLINILIQENNYKTYLEIGVFKGETFKKINCDIKDSVDSYDDMFSKLPSDKEFNVKYRMSSDEFFEKVAPTLNYQYDIIFIDGLHITEQVDRDIENSLMYLNENGTIILHDCNPESYDIQIVPQIYEYWSGDVWKSVVKIRQRKDLKVFVIDSDTGLGVITKNKITLEEKSKTENNLGKWNGWYKNLDPNPSSFRYADTITYQKAADFLSDCSEVEDWGCGAGGFLRYRPDAIGVDGSDTVFAIKKSIDLSNYISDCESVHIGHVFEHNYKWKDILYNALKSARRKLSITMFIPLSDDTVEIAHNKKHGVDVPDLKISKDEFFSIINDFNPTDIKIESLDTPSGYGKEQIIFITK